MDSRNSLLLELNVAFYGCVENLRIPSDRFPDPDRIIETIEMENTMLRLIRDLKSDNKGVTMIEYALIAGLVSVVAIAMLTAMGTCEAPERKQFGGTTNQLSERQAPHPLI